MSAFWQERYVLTIWQDLKLYSIQERGELCPLVISNGIDVIGRRTACTHTKKTHQKTQSKKSTPPPKPNVIGNVIFHIIVYFLHHLLVESILEATCTNIYPSTTIHCTVYIRSEGLKMEMISKTLYRKTEEVLMNNCSHYVRIRWS